MIRGLEGAFVVAVSLPIRGAWIEIYVVGMKIAPAGMSLPIRGAWIEIGA